MGIKKSATSVVENTTGVITNTAKTLGTASTGAVIILNKGTGKLTDGTEYVKDKVDELVNGKSTHEQLSCLKVDLDSRKADIAKVKSKIERARLRNQMRGQLYSEIDYATASNNLRNSTINPDNWVFTTGEEVNRTAADFDKLGISPSITNNLFNNLRIGYTELLNNPKCKNAVVYRDPDKYINTSFNDPKTEKFITAYREFNSIKDSLLLLNTVENGVIKKIQHENDSFLDKPFDIAKDFVGGLKTDFKKGDYASAVPKLMIGYGVFKLLKSAVGLGGSGKFSNLLTLGLLAVPAYHYLPQLKKGFNFALDASDKYLGTDIDYRADETSRFVKGPKYSSPSSLALSVASSRYHKVSSETIARASFVNINDLNHAAHDQKKQFRSQGLEYSKNWPKNFINPKFSEKFLRGRDQFKGMSPGEVKEPYNKLSGGLQKYAETGRELWNMLGNLKEQYNKTLRKKNGMDFDKYVEKHKDMDVVDMIAALAVENFAKDELAEINEDLVSIEADRVIIKEKINHLQGVIADTTDQAKKTKYKAELASLNAEYVILNRSYASVFNSKARLEKRINARVKAKSEYSA